MVIAALIVGRLAWQASSHVLERIFPDPNITEALHPFYVRAHAYNPLVRGLVRTIIGILVFLLILQGWGVTPSTGCCTTRSAAR